MNSEIPKTTQTPAKQESLDMQVANFHNLSAQEQDVLAKQVVEQTKQRQTISRLSTVGWSMIWLAIVFAVFDAILILSVGSPYASLGLPDYAVVSANTVAHLAVLIAGIGILMRYDVARKIGVAAMIVNLAVIIPTFIQAAAAALIYIVFAFMNPPGIVAAVCILARLGAYPYLINQLSFPAIKEQLKRQRSDKFDK